MRREEIDPSLHKQILANAIREHMASISSVFSPWDGLEFYYDCDALYLWNGTRIASNDDLRGKSDDEILGMVMFKLPAIVHRAKICIEESKRV